MLPPKILEGRVAIVTGGSAGIGKATAVELARLGATLAVAARGSARLNSVVDLLRASGGKAIGIACDIVEPSAVKHLVAEVVQRFGSLDILVNSVGWGSVKRAEELSIEDWTKSINANLHAAFYVTQAAGIEMIRNGAGGSIVNVAASRGWNGSPQTVHVGCAKAAVLSMTKTLAVEWARHNIRVNALAPGGFQTERQAQDIWSNHQVFTRIIGSIPLRRVAHPEEAAWAISYLVSDFAKYITGEVLTVDGGWMLNQFSYLDDPAISDTNR